MFNYNKNVRPVRNNSDLVTIKIGLKLIQIADVVCTLCEIFESLVFLLYLSIQRNSVVRGKRDNLFARVCFFIKM